MFVSFLPEHNVCVTDYTWLVERAGATQGTLSGRPCWFANGNIQTPESVNFTLYKNKDHTSSRTKKQRILAAETDRLSYAGNNFSTEALKCNSLSRYFVGVLNKETGTMEVYDAERFTMQPILENSNSEGQSQDVTDQSSRTYREKVDALIEAFGTNKQKRALSSRKLNQVGSEILSKAMAKAADEIIETKGTAELVKEAMNTNEESSLFLPPCDASADKPENVYRFDHLISPVDYAALETVSSSFKNITSEELKTLIEKKQHGFFVQQELQELKLSKDIDRQARSLWYLDILIKLSQLKIVKRKDLIAYECPNVLCGNLMKNFTVTTFRNNSVTNSISGTMKSKIVAYVIALALHISEFQVDLTFLQRDLKLTENRILEIAKAMGLKISKKMTFSDRSMDDGHKVGTLSLPLTLYKPSGRMIKRKKM
ncbi:DNA-directed RNA polymerase I subunit RPA49 isoform X2 [Mixophyes fleayi]|uniref:DNA-directed RNA polymerase I subunit RPA49 isoform X2 n=1 Tax=Mixophyes fleayi TaxID=3061075 RepID=UPI003F4DD967